MFKLFKALYFLGFVLLYGLVASLAATAAVPAITAWRYVAGHSSSWVSAFVVIMCLMLGLTCWVFITAIFIRIVGRFLPIHEGRSSVYGAQMVIWAVQYFLMNVMNTFFLPVFRTTPLMNLFYRLMGAQVGKNVFFNSSYLYEPHLIEIGDNSRIGENALIAPHTTEGKTFMCKRIRIGANVTIGQYAQILPGATIGDGAIVGAGAIVPKDYVIAPATIHGGNPITLLKVLTQSHIEGRNEKRDS